MKVDPEFKHLIVPLSEKERTLLEEGIKRDGCRAPLDVWKEEDILLDGHNRLEICKKLNVEYRINYVSLPDRTAAKIWILENQAGRRNLSKSQLAVLALDLEKLYAKSAKDRMLAGKAEDPRDNLSQGYQGRARDQAAEKYGIKGKEVGRAKTVKNRGIPELFDAVKSGNATVGAAEQVSRLSPVVQKAIVSKGPDIIKRSSTIIHDLAPAEKITPGITEKAVAKVITGEATTPHEAIEKTLPDEDLRRFREFDRKTNAAVNEAVRGVTRSFNGAGKACFMPNVKELWCEDCEWGFDVFLPAPRDDISCPYCKGQNLINRDKEWHPGR